MIDRRLLLAGGGVFVGLGLWRGRGIAAAYTTTDFSLVGALTQAGWARGLAPPRTTALTLAERAVSVAPDGSFFIAFDRDSAPSLQLAARLSDGRTVARSLTISPRAWQIEHIPLGPKPGTPPSEDFARRRNTELALINAARSVDHIVDGWRQSFVWSVHGRVSGQFGAQRIYNGIPGSYHSGLDIATGVSGTRFVAPADGVVTLAAESPFSL